MRSDALDNLPLPGEQARLSLVYIMKPKIHPKLNPVVFVDTGAGTEFISRSTLSSKNTRDIDGVSHFVVQVDISSASHPFYTGKQRAIAVDGRVEKFNRKYGIAKEAVKDAE